MKPSEEFLAELFGLLQRWKRAQLPSEHAEALDEVKSLIAERVKAITDQKDGAYRERDALVCALSKVFPAHLCRHPEEDREWEDDWRWIVCVHLPTGQATWHIHDSERPHFDHLTVSQGHWDGHTTEEKYQRLAALATQAEREKAARIEGMEEFYELACGWGHDYLVGQMRVRIAEERAK